MSHWLDEPRVRQDVVTIPRLWVTIAASALIHLAILFIWIPRTQLVSTGHEELDRLTERLEVRLDTSAQKPEPPPAMRPSPPSPTTPPRTMARLRPPPLVAPSREAPVIAEPPPAPPAVAAPPPPPPAVAASPRQPIEGDLAAYIDAKR